ncbi:hypothetical protein E2C01_082268 [Portunus trituberculatus]|uniref:Uncharacterized protein n=1 Tax=Portunus trituberculatus TaxID=210409 RepID=A0A5B7J152_PORTR|nr:hypothetical protein [Portunus trituberculatus]
MTHPAPADTPFQETHGVISLGSLLTSQAGSECTDTQGCLTYSHKVWWRGKVDGLNAPLHRP